MVKRAVAIMFVVLGLMACENGTTNIPIDQGGNDDGLSFDSDMTTIDDDNNTDAASDDDSLEPADGDMSDGSNDGVSSDTDISSDEIAEGDDVSTNDDGEFVDNSVDGDTTESNISEDDPAIADDANEIDFDIQPDEVVITEIVRREPTDKIQNVYLGHRLALWGDRLIASAYFSSFKGEASGSALIFERNYGGVDNWGERKVLIPADGTNDELFGWNVAINSDHAFVLKRYDMADAKKGAVLYYYRKDQGGIDNWGYVKKRVLNGGGVNFPQYVKTALLTTDELLFIGGPCDDAINTPPGCVFIHSRNLGGANNWGLLKELRPNDGMGGDQFGAALALNEDRLVVGATSLTRDTNIYRAGAVYVFERNEGGTNNWGQVTKILRPETSNLDDNFGAVVAISGDYLMVGFPNDAYWGDKTGAVYVFYRNEGGEDNWGLVQKMLPDENPQLAVGGEFGTSLAAKGPLLFAGAPRCGDILHQDFYYPGAMFGYFNSMAAEAPYGYFARMRFDYTLEADTTSSFGKGVVTDGSILAVGYPSSRAETETPGEYVYPGEVLFYRISY